MTRYTVWHETARHDGDAGFDDLAKAQQEFDDQCARPAVMRVELQDNSNPDDPIVLRVYDVRRQDENA